MRIVDQPLQRIYDVSDSDPFIREEDVTERVQPRYTKMAAVNELCDIHICSPVHIELRDPRSNRQVLFDRVGRVRPSLDSRLVPSMSDSATC